MVRRLLFLVIVKQNSGFLLGMEKEQQSSVSSVIVVNLNLHPVQTRWLCNHIIKLPLIITAAIRGRCCNEPKQQVLDSCKNGP